MEDRDRIETVLAQTAKRLDAAVVAVYEVGRTFNKTVASQVDDRTWTGIVYLVGSWTPHQVTLQSDELDGLPDALKARGNAYLMDVICHKTSCLIDDPVRFPEIFAASAASAANACAAILTSASFNDHFPTVAILYYADLTLAQRHFGPMREGQTDHPGAAALVSDQERIAMEELHNLGDRMVRRAEQRHFEFLARFQQDYFRAMGQPTIEAQERAFDTLVRTEVGLLAEHLHCSDLRVYLLSDPGAVEADDTGAQASLGGSGPQRFPLRWASWPDAPPWPVSSDDPGPIGWCLQEGKTLGVHNRRVMRDFPDARENAYPGLRDMESYGADDCGQPMALLGSGPPSRIGSVQSLIIHPIAIGGRTVGAMVCNGRNRAPYLFHEWDETSLGVIAVTIGGNWLKFSAATGGTA